ncbi:MAG: aminopeptidase N [Sulfuriferula sp.]
MHTIPTVYRQDYRPYPFQIAHLNLIFDLEAAHTRVHSEMRLTQMHADMDLVLHGDGLTLLSIHLDGRELNAATDYVLTNDSLRVLHPPETFTLTIVTQIQPDQNSTLMGLYASNGNLFTQCEAEGFRKITYFPDRPDVMTQYTVELRADAQHYPVLLSNGNLVDEGVLDDGRHYAKWIDPFKKPSYLFALVAGKLVCQEEKFILASGREVLLQVWVEDGNLDKTQHAMESLKNSIRWDEQRFGLELDLDRFMIVAVSDFNMGAMENKGLNIFNTKYVLANPRVATDTDYANIESVVGHEYFHNWTGNRVTCQDWFQLSLKEGLTVFRDQEFSADMVGTESGRAVKRIEDVRMLRQVQFSEDAGPMAHPVRPDSYVEINNFYTVTIYEKGAEVVRMYQTLLGRDGFRKGMDLYFSRHDGCAVTCDDFRAAMADANGYDLNQFERWYSQAGTPTVKVKTSYDADKQQYTLTLRQFCAPTAGQADKLPFHIPVTVGLLDTEGQDMPLYLSGATSAVTSCVLELTETEQSFVFDRIPALPTPSLLRNFSAPVVLEYAYSDAELAHLLAHDSDAFNRWEAGQRLATQRLMQLIKAVQAGEALSLDSLYLDALRLVLNDANLDPAFRELVLSLPSEAMLAELSAVIDPHAIHAAREFMRQQLGTALHADFQTIYQTNQTAGIYSPDAISAGKRGLKNLALSYLLDKNADEQSVNLALTQVRSAQNMTDRLAALSALVRAGQDNAAEPLHDFYRDFADDALVIDKWFSLQASAPNTDVQQVRKLMQHPDFNLHNPNRARSLIFSFCHANPLQLHVKDGSGYAFWVEQVLALNAINPQVAARLVRVLDHWRKYQPVLRSLMQDALHKVANTPDLSKDVQELVVKMLK